MILINGQTYIYDNDGNIYLVLSGQVWINGEQPSQPNIAKWTADSSGNLGLTENLFSRLRKFENSCGTDWNYLKGKIIRDINFDSENIWFASWNGTEQQYLFKYEQDTDTLTKYWDFPGTAHRL